VAETSSTPKPGPTRAVIVDDHPFFREGLVSWLNSHPGFQCCGEAATVVEGLEVIAQTNPDLVLLDLQLMDGDGLELLGELSKRTTPPAVIVISRKDEDVYAARAIRAGARGYVMKEEAPETLMEAIKKVMDGGIFVGARVVTSLATGGAHEGVGLLTGLSNRELEVFERLGRGYTSKAVAADLGVSVKTIDTYRESLKKKLKLPDGLALIRAATLWHQDAKPPKPE
jgi:DNA-binding NarL/FixJ family response regulator